MARSPETSAVNAISAIKPYPTYKPSGIEWLGDVPGHWGQPRTKVIFRERVEKGFPQEPLLAATQQLGVVRKDRYENRTVLALKDLHLLKRVHARDFVISLRSFEGGIEYAHDGGIISPAYTIIKADQSYACNEYFALLFKSAPYLENLRLHVTGIREGQNIDYVKLSRSRIPLPPITEQRAIARYLDYMDSRIQRYIKAKERLIELLEEQKRAVINQAVTRGLDPDVPLKPSGVEWLGDVPAHWEVRRLKHVCRLIYGDSLPSEARIGDAYAVYGSNGPVGSHASANTLGPCIVVGRKGSFGKVNYSQSAVFAIDTTFYVDSTSTSADIKWLSYSLSILGLDAITKDSAIPGLDREEAYATRMPYCGLSEQRKIADHLDRMTTKINAQIARVVRQIELMKEYRARLIADVVTGKLDVRDAAANLPDDEGGGVATNRDSAVHYPGTEA